MTRTPHVTYIAVVERNGGVMGILGAFSSETIARRTAQLWIDLLAEDMDDLIVTVTPYQEDHQRERISTLSRIRGSNA